MWYVSFNIHMRLRVFLFIFDQYIVILFTTCSFVNSSITLVLVVQIFTMITKTQADGEAQQSSDMQPSFMWQEMYKQKVR